RHPPVHQHHVGAGAADRRDRLLPVGRLGHHLDVGGAFEDHHQPRPDRPLILRHHDPDHRPASASRSVPSCSAARPPVFPSPHGSSTRTRQVPSPTGPAENSPPSSTARSRMPTSPTPAPLSSRHSPGSPVTGLSTCTTSRSGAAPGAGGYSTATAARAGCA